MLTLFTPSNRQKMGAMQHKEWQSKVTNIVLEANPFEFSFPLKVFCIEIFIDVWVFDYELL